MAQEGKLTLCLVESKTGRRVVESVASSTTVSELYTSVVPSALQCLDQTVEALSAGFPPRRLELSDQTLYASGISSQERITVKWQEASKKNSKKTKAKKATVAAAAAAPKAIPSTPPAGRSKRVAAEKATASFAETIRQQDELLKQQSTPSTTRRTASSSSAASNTKKPPKRPRFPTQSTGRRLADGAVVSRPRKKPVTRQYSGDADPATALMDAVSAPTAAGRLMRQGWKQAVQSAHEQNRAVTRLAALTSGKVQYETVSTETTANDDDTEVLAILKVTYDKGVQGRGQWTDEVDLIPETVLAQVVQALHPTNPEALRPENLALLSPRVLWSLTYHYHQRNDNETPARRGRTGVVQQALMALHPDLDWSFLRRRKEQLSAKALENLRQAGNDDGNTSFEAAAAAIASVEQAMEEVHALDRRAKQSQLAGAATARLSCFQIVTPTEADLDELIECIAGHDDIDETKSGVDESSTVKVLAQALMDKCMIHNWRELANAEADVLIPKLKHAVEEGPLEMTKVEEWIERAQLATLDEVMMEICDNKAETVQLLADHARAGTPKDLAVWKSIVEVLQQELTIATSDETHLPSQQELARYCDRAEQALEQLEWLNLYATPIAD